MEKHQQEYIINMTNHLKDRIENTKNSLENILKELDDNSHYVYMLKNLHKYNK